MTAPPGALFSAREWKVGDRCRATRFGESKNGTVVAIAYKGEVVMVQRDGEYVERHYLARNLHEAVDE